MIIKFGTWLTVVNQQWYNARVKTLPDILDEEGNFLSFPEFRKKYKIKTNFLRYFGFCNAIPKYLKEAFYRDLVNESVGTAQSTHPLNLSFWTCQQARSLYVSKTFPKSTSKARLIKAGFTDRSIEALYILPFKVTKNIKLSMFQFKINYHILYTRDKFSELTLSKIMPIVWRKTDPRASVRRMSARPFFLEPSCLLVELL